MTVISIDIPNQEDISLFSTKEKIKVLDILADMQAKALPVIISLVEEVVYPIIKDKPELFSLHLDPNYEYNDEGYCHTNIMPFLNDDWDGWEHSDVRAEIDDALADLAKYIPREEDGLTINLNELRSRFGGTQLQSPTKIKKSRYNVD